MEEDTRKLLQECNKGCKMAIDSMEQVKGHISDDSLEKVIDEYEEKHRKIEDESSVLLDQAGQEEKEPGAAASTFAWMSTGMKLAMNDDNRQIAKLMMDGCNMGIQSISENINKYPEASKESIHIAKDLVKMEEAFMGELKDFL